MPSLSRRTPKRSSLLVRGFQYRCIPSSTVSTKPGGDWGTFAQCVRVSPIVSVFRANELLDASYRIYRRAETNDTVTRTVGYEFPVVLHAHVQSVVATTYFASVVMLRTPKILSGRAAAGQVKAASGEFTTGSSGRDDPIRSDSLPCAGCTTRLHMCLLRWTGTRSGLQVSVISTVPEPEWIW